MCKSRSAYATPDEPCPYCGEMCSAEFVDIGVGMMQCSPYYCHGCQAVEIGPTTTPERELTDDEKRTGWTIQEPDLMPLQKNVRSMFADVIGSDFMDASDHNAKCKCAKCLQWWLTMGPEETSYGWSFGPFTEAEFVAAGGVMPEHEPETMTESEVIAQWMGGGELW